MIIRIIIHATDTPAGVNMTLDDIEDLKSVDRHADPMPYHYIINPGGFVLKGKKNRELNRRDGSLIDKVNQRTVPMAHFDVRKWLGGV